MELKSKREAERAKYTHVYSAMPNYAMGGLRMVDAIEDLKWAVGGDCLSYLDIGCGRGEMLDHADALGFATVQGFEIVPELCNDRVRQMAVHELHKVAQNSYDMVSSFDVIEHLIPGDDELLVRGMGRIARKCLALTANNRPSIDPTTGNDLHINKRHYDEWDALIREWLPDWNVHRCNAKQYVSETWRAYR